MAIQKSEWRSDLNIASGSLLPCIYETEVFNFLSKNSQNLRLVLSTCDLDFLIKNIQNLVTYQSSASAIPFAVGVYSDFGGEAEMQSALDKIKQQYNLSKLIFFVFSCSKLHSVLSKLDGDEILWDYKINYIRNARYNLVEPIWGIAGVNLFDLTLSSSSIYVVDFDNFFTGDLNHHIKRVYGQNKMVFSWNSLQSPNKNFPNMLTGVIIKNNLSFNHSYKIVKAGFTAIAPNPLSRLFLQLYQFYSIGDPSSVIYIRLFTFYFSDQVAILLALNDIKSHSPSKYSSSIAWIDIATSEIINLDRQKASCMWYPKGKNFKVLSK